MPELPEVETIRRDLAPLVTGRGIVSLTVLPGGERVLQGIDAEAVAMRLVGRRVAALERRGKYLLFRLDDDQVLAVHLRMTGSLRHRRAGEAPDRFLRAVIALDDGTELRFTDIRKFGTFQVGTAVEEVTPPLGPEPGTPAFTEAALWAGLRGRRVALKSALLNQALVAGVGNIYADEALFLARLHPEVPAGALRPAERRSLRDAVETVIREGIRHRGASFRDYTDGKGEAGAQQFYVRVFRRTGQPCDDCGSIIRRTVVGGRATHWCPGCQPVGQRRRRRLAACPQSSGGAD